MAQQSANYNRPPVRKRRKKTKMQIFKEAYLPLLMPVGVVILIIGLIVGGVKLRKNAKIRQENRESSLAAQQEADRLAQEAIVRGKALLPQAEQLAAQYDYDGAISLLESFDGSAADVPGMSDAIARYRSAKSTLVLWEDPAKIPNISFQSLIAKANLAFASGDASDYKDYNVTVEEFSAILEQLYANGYVLVSLSDAAVAVAKDGGVQFTTGEIYLPVDKKPLILSQLPLNYDFPAGHGFASRLVVGVNGKPTCEYLNSAGETTVGAFDLVPLLDEFVEAHPDFSYKGAKATLAFTGKNGVLGYNTQPSAKEELGEEAYNQEVAAAKKVAQALLDDGYTLASFTYGGIPYGSSSLSYVQADLLSWQQEVEPIIGKTNVLFYYSGSDIAGAENYSGDKYNALSKAGFRYFLGMDNSTAAWMQIADDYVRQTRRTINGVRLTENPEAVEDLFDASKVVSDLRK